MLLFFQYSCCLKHQSMSIYADDWNIYMFMLRISICCFWNNQNRSERKTLAQLWFFVIGGWSWLFAAKWKKCFAFLQGLVSFVLGSLDLWYPSKCLFSTVSGLFSLRFTQHGDISTVMVYTILLTQHTDPAKSGYNIHLGDVIAWAVHFIHKHI